MQVGDVIEFGPGLKATVVWPGDAMYACFIMERDGQYAACEGDETEFSFVFEEDAWRDSFTDAMCDIEIADERMNQD